MDGSLFVPFTILVLVVVIVLQAVDKHMTSETHQKEVSKLIAAVMAKNIQEYTGAVKAETEKVVDVPPSDEIDLSNATDIEFDKFIKSQDQS